jgi:hypothetical protein
MLVLATVVAIGGAAAPRALADDGAPPATFHAGQLGVSARFGVGLRGIATYDRGVYCGATDSSGYAPVCTGRTPFALGLEGSYGVTRKIELLAELRLGLERSFAASPGQGDGPRLLQLAPGARFFFSESGHTRLFVTAQLALDFSGYKDAAGMSRGMDFGVRSLQGLWFDLHRAYGFYVFAGETITVSRWLEGDLEAGIGIQGRYP